MELEEIAARTVKTYVLTRRVGDLGWHVEIFLEGPKLAAALEAHVRSYPVDIINFGNTRGADKVIFSGYFPSGLSYERVFGYTDEGQLLGHLSIGVEILQEKRL